MAEEGVIEKRLRVYFQAVGVRDVEKTLKDIRGGTADIYGEIDRLEGEWGHLDDAVKKVGSQYLRTNKVGRDGLKAQGAAIRGLSDDFDDFTKHVKLAGLAVAKLAVPYTFHQSVGLVDEYNKSLLASASRMTRFGVGLKETETRLTSLGRQLSFTRMQTLNLFKTYEQGFKFVSLGNFERLLGNINKAVGANAEETQNLLGIIGGLSQRYPGLARAIGSVEQADKDRASQQLKGLLLAQKISDTEYRGIQAVLTARRQLTPGDKLREQTIQNQIKAMQDLRKTGEEIGIAMGQAILPVIEDISKVIKSLNIDFGTLAKTAVAVGGAIAAIKIGGVLNMGVRGLTKIGSAMDFGYPKTPLNMLSSGKMARGGGGGGKGSAAAGSALAALGGDVVRVYVTNFNEMLGVSRSQHSINTGTYDINRRAEDLKKKDTWWSRMRGRATGKESLRLGGKGLGGIAGGLGRAVGGFAKSPGAIVAGALGIPLMSYLESKAADAGSIKGAAAAGLGGSAVGILGAAGSGAMLGSFVPVIGTAVGAVLGGSLGFLKTMPSIFEDLKSVITGVAAGPTEEEKKVADRDARIKEDVSKRIAEEKEKPKTVEAIIEQSISMSGGELLNKLKELKDGKKSVDNLQKAADDATDDFNDFLDKIVKVPGVTDKVSVHLAALGDEIKREQALLAGMEAAGASSEALDQQKDVVKEKEKEKTKVLELQRDAVLTNDTLRERKSIMEDANAAAEEAKNQAEAIEQTTLRQQEIVSAVHELYEKQVGVLDAVLERMSITGEIDVGAASNQIKGTIAILNEEIKQRRMVNSIFNEYLATGKKTTVDEVKRMGGSKETLALAQRLNLENIHEKEMRGLILENDRAIISQRAEIVNQSLKITKIYEGQLNLASAQAAQMDKMVTLADNFAIGVGASAQLRLKAFQAEEKRISILNEEYQAQAALLAEGGEKAVKAKERLVEIENEILDAQIKQAGQVKALRDGWISAIGAMNTGAGTFSKIIIDQEQAVSASLKMGGIVSSRSGAFSSFGADGRMLEEAGYRESTRFSATPGGGLYLPGQTGGQGNFAYRTSTGVDRYVDEGMRKGLERMIDFKTGREGAGGQDQSRNFASLALGANRHVMGQFMQQASMTGNPFENPRGTGVPARRGDEREGRGASRTGAGAFSARLSDLGDNRRGTAFDTGLSVVGAGGRFNVPEAMPQAAVVDKMLGVLAEQGKVDPDVLRKRTLAEQAVAIGEGANVSGQLTGETEARRKEQALIEATKDMSDKEIQGIYDQAGMTTASDRKELEELEEFRGARFGAASTDPNVRKEAERPAPTVAEADATVELMKVGQLIVDNFVGGPGGGGSSGAGRQTGGGGASVGDGTSTTVSGTPGAAQDDMNKKTKQLEEENRLLNEQTEATKKMNTEAAKSGAIGEQASKGLREKANALEKEAAEQVKVGDSIKETTREEKKRTAEAVTAANVESTRVEIAKQKAKTAGGTMATSPPMSVTPSPVPAMSTEALNVFESQKSMLQGHIDELQKKDSKISSSMEKSQTHLAGIKDAQQENMKAIMQNQKKQAILKTFREDNRSGISKAIEKAFASGKGNKFIAEGIFGENKPLGMAFRGMAAAGRGVGRGIEETQGAIAGPAGYLAYQSAALTGSVLGKVTGVSDVLAGKRANREWIDEQGGRASLSGTRLQDERMALGADERKEEQRLGILEAKHGVSQQSMKTYTKASQGLEGNIDALNAISENVTMARTQYEDKYQQIEKDAAEVQRSFTSKAFSSRAELVQRDYDKALNGLETSKEHLNNKLTYHNTTLSEFNNAIKEITEKRSEVIKDDTIPRETKSALIKNMSSSIVSLRKQVINTRENIMATDEEIMAVDQDLRNMRNNRSEMVMAKSEARMKDVFDPVAQIDQDKTAREVMLENRGAGAMSHREASAAIREFNKPALRASRAADKSGEEFEALKEQRKVLSGLKDALGGITTSTLVRGTGFSPQEMAQQAQAMGVEKYAAILDKRIKSIAALSQEAPDLDMRELQRRGDLDQVLAEVGSRGAEQGEVFAKALLAAPQGLPVDVPADPFGTAFAAAASAAQFAGFSNTPSELSSADRGFREAQIRGTQAMMNMAEGRLSGLVTEQNRIAEGLDRLHNIPVGGARHLGGGSFSPITDEWKRQQSEVAHIRAVGTRTTMFEGLKGDELDEAIDKFVTQLEEAEKGLGEQVKVEKDHVAEMKTAQEEARMVLKEDAEKSGVGFDFRKLTSNVKGFFKETSDQMIASKADSVPVEDFQIMELRKYRNEMDTLREKYKAEEDPGKKQELRRELRAVRRRRDEYKEEQGITGATVGREFKMDQDSIDKLGRGLTEEQRRQQVAFAQVPTAEGYNELFPTGAAPPVATGTMIADQPMPAVPDATQPFWMDTRSYAEANPMEPVESLLTGFDSMLAQYTGEAPTMASTPTIAATPVMQAQGEGTTVINNNVNGVTVKNAFDGTMVNTVKGELNKSNEITARAAVQASQKLAKAQVKA
tara:strand:+ start:5877 stop:13385 length:7509 start_codon:yes stop_codon:yes gene_type:complete